MRVLLTILVLFASIATAAAQPATEIAGVVLDASGAPIAGATVSIGGVTATTSTDGTFRIVSAGGPVTLSATAPGFARAAVQAEASRHARIVLHPAPISDRVVVTASRGAEGVGSAASTTVVTSAELLNSAAGSLDDALRSTPGFSLFRRSSSRVSNPTTQGVTLRGVSGSGASRTLVLADGLPLNDPFGSWVYWNRVPQAAVERVEIVRGASGDLYGADALGGVVQVLTFAPGHSRVRLTLDGGSHDTGRVSTFANGQRGGWHAEGAGEWLRTSGVVLVGREAAGPIDVRADSDYGTGFVGGGYNAGTWHAGVRLSLYDENRNNGTPQQVNTTSWKQVSGDAGGSAAGGGWLVRGAAGRQEYYQTFSAVATDRASERLTTEQTTPSRFGTGAAQWTRGWGSTSILVGAEGRRTRATVEELRYSFTNVQTGPFFAGGTETNGAVFGRISVAPASRLTLVLGAREDFWRSKPNDGALPTHSTNFFSPRVSAGFAVATDTSLHVAAYRSYRTPSLNELHRGFRVGTIVTNPNPLLNPERLTGVEGGILYTRARVSARVTGFLNELDDAVTNVTLTVTPTQTTRERQNTQTVRASGVEVEADVRPHPRWTIGGLAVVTRSRFQRAPEQPEIEGNRVPQVPTYQLGGTLTYVDPVGFTASMQARVFGAQFDDDLNAIQLNRYQVVDLSASQQLHRGINLFVAVENLFDEDYDAGRTPRPGGLPDVRTVGWPRTMRVGVRLFLP